MPKFVLLFTLFAIFGAIFAGPTREKRQLEEDKEKPYTADFLKVIVECKNSKVVFSYYEGGRRGNIECEKDGKIFVYEPKQLTR